MLRIVKWACVFVMDNFGVYDVGVYDVALYDTIVINTGLCLSVDFVQGVFRRLVFPSVSKSRIIPIVSKGVVSPVLSKSNITPYCLRIE